MIGTISYLVKVDRHHWLKSIIAFALLSSASAVAVSVIVWTVGAWLRAQLGVTSGSQLVGISAPFVIAYTLTSGGHARVPFHGVRRQVPKLWWDDYGPTIGGALYGVELGAGFSTTIPQPTYWIMLLWEMGWPNITGAVGGAALFVLGLNVPIWFASFLAQRGVAVDEVALWALNHHVQLARLNACAILSTFFVILLVR